MNLLMPAYPQAFKELNSFQMLFEEDQRIARKVQFLFLAEQLYYSKVKLQKKTI